MPLGGPTTDARVRADVSVAAGSTLLLCTDGMVETRGGDIDDDLARLVAAVGRHRADDGPQALVDRLVGGPCELNDVVAVLAVNLLRGPGAGDRAAAGRGGPTVGRTMGEAAVGIGRVGPALPAEALVGLREPVHRYLARHTDDPHELEDLTQEALARVWEARRRIDRSVAASYAVATARNLVLSERRAEVLHRRHQHRLLDARSAPSPDEGLLRGEEQRAARQALLGLEDEDRRLLQTHYWSPPGDRGDAGAGPSASRGPGVTSRLARARARARVAYLLALRRIDPPGPRCRQVLDALSAGDRRLQRRVGAAEHLLVCDTCAGCAPALLGRRRVLFGLVPAPLLVLLEPLRRAYERAPRTTTVATGAATAAALAVAVSSVVSSAPADAPPVARTLPAAAPAAGAPSAPAVPPVPAAEAGATGEVTVAGSPVPAGRWGEALVGTGAARTVVVGEAVPVESVPADEGFWVGTADQRFWVGLATATESPQGVRPGYLVSFTGPVVPVTASSAPGLEEAEGRGELERQQGYVSVAPDRLSVRRPDVG